MRLGLASYFLKWTETKKLPKLFICLAHEYVKKMGSKKLGQLLNSFVNICKLTYFWGAYNVGPSRVPSSYLVTWSHISQTIFPWNVILRNIEYLYRPLFHFDSSQSAKRISFLSLNSSLILVKLEASYFAILCYVNEICNQVIKKLDETLVRHK